METNLTSSFSGFQFTTSRISTIHSQVAAGSYKSPFSGIFMFFFCVYMPSYSISSLWLRLIDGGGCVMQMFGMVEKEMEYQVDFFQPVSDAPSSCCTTTSPPPGWGLWDQIACEIRSLVDAMNCGYCWQIWGWGKKTRSNFSLVWSLELQDKVRIPISLPLFLCLQMPLN